jgi:hypothetical protein
MEWGNSLRIVGLKHEILPHYGQSILIITKGAKYGK